MKATDVGLAERQRRVDERPGVDVGRGVDAEDPLVPLARDVLLGGGRDDLGDAVLLGLLGHGVGAGGGVGADDGGDLVAGGQLLDGADGLVGLAGVVLADHLDVDPLLLEVLEGQLEAVGHGLADGGLGAGDGVDEADLDGGRAGQPGEGERGGGRDGEDSGHEAHAVAPSVRGGWRRRKLEGRPRPKATGAPREMRSARTSASRTRRSASHPAWWWRRRRRRCGTRS